MTPPEMWPFTDAVTPAGRHRIIHIWPTRWHRDGKAVGWSGAEELRQLAGTSDDTSFGDAFQGQLKRQYQRVAERLPHLAGSPEVIELGHPMPAGECVWMDGHCFFARMPSGHLLACANVLYDGSLGDLPSLLVAALEHGPRLPVRRKASEEPLEGCINEMICGTRELKRRAEKDPAWAEGLELRLTSEMHSIVFASDGDAPLFTPDGRPDEQLVARLLGRLDNDTVCAKDETIKWPSEFNKLPQTIGAVRPGASVVTGVHPHASGNVLVSTLLLMAAASLLREARDEVYSVQQNANAAIESDKLTFDWRGRGPLGKELSRLAHVEIAVAFNVESHFDMRRIISDAMLVQWHGCFAEALDISRSVTALHEMASHLVSGMQTITQRSTARNAFIVAGLAAIFTVAAFVVSLVLAL